MPTIAGMDVEDPQVIEPEIEQPQAVTDPPPEDEGEVTVTIGDEEAPEGHDEKKNAPWVNELRKSNREKDRVLRQQEGRIKELESKLAPTAPIVGPEPTLEGCGYDADKFKGEYKAWMARSQEAENQQRKVAEQQQKFADEWNGKLAVYGQAKAKLKVSDFQAAEDVVKGTLNEMQQSILIGASNKPELLVYALGKSPAKAKELAAMDPARFAFALGQLETQLKVTPKKPGVSAERIPQGGSSAAGAAVDNQLDKLREEAAKTGDLSKVMAFKRKQGLKTA